MVDIDINCSILIKMRYLPHTPDIRLQMLAHIGANHVDDFYQHIDPSLLNPDFPELPLHQNELDVERYFQFRAKLNTQPAQNAFFIGAGLYRHHVPACVDYLIQRGEFLTSYTPYQPEVSQGTLQYLFEFQTQICRLTGLDVANASMYDGATALAEALMMANRITGRQKVLLSGGVHPHYAQTCQTYARFGGFNVHTLMPHQNDCADLLSQISDDLSCVVIQSPNFFGELQDYREIAKCCREKGIVVIHVFNEVLSLGAFKSPAEMGADICVGEGQSLGVGLNFGGPTVGLFSCKKAFLRQMPGRVVGQTTDANGDRGFVLTLSTREQHIRREKATSNICTNSGLCALAFTIHVSLLGRVGFKNLVSQNHARAIEMYQGLLSIPDLTILNKTFFNEITIQIKKSACAVVDLLLDHAILGGVPLSRFYQDQDDKIILACTELTTSEDIAHLVQSLKEVLA